MKITSLVLALAVLAASSSAFAATHSDFTKAFPLQTLKTFQFKPQTRISRDPLANNDIWSNDLKTAIRTDLSAHGLTEAANGTPDFYIAYYVGLKDRYDLNAIDYGMPLFRPGRWGWWGWPSGYDAWAVPYTESTVIIDVVDAHTNQLVWRGYDSETLNTGKPDKTLSKAVEHVLSKFYQDAQKQAHV